MCRGCGSVRTTYNYIPRHSIPLHADKITSAAQPAKCPFGRLRRLKCNIQYTNYATLSLPSTAKFRLANFQMHRTQSQIQIPIAA